MRPTTIRPAMTGSHPDPPCLWWRVLRLRRVKREQSRIVCASCRISLQVTLNAVAEARVEPRNADQHEAQDDERNNAIHGFEMPQVIHEQFQDAHQEEPESR